MLMDLFSGPQEMPRVVLVDLVVRLLTVDSMLVMEQASSPILILEQLPSSTSPPLQMWVCLVCGHLEWIGLLLFSQVTLSQVVVHI